MAEIPEKPKPSVTVRHAAQRIFRHENAILMAVLIAMIGVLGVITKGMLVTRANIMNIILQSSMRGVSSVGQAFVILTAGIDLSIEGIALMVVTLGATLMTGTTPFPFVPLAIMLLVGAGIGSLNGLSVTRVGMPALMVTLAMWQIAKGGAYQISRGYTITKLPPGMAFLGSGVVAGVPVPIIIFIVVAV
ncbi:hypothetical protein ES703_86732 [subsurface metagenome]